MLANVAEDGEAVSKKVQFCVFGRDAVAVVEYAIGDFGFVRFYLAPKIADEDEN